MINLWKGNRDIDRLIDRANNGKNGKHRMNAPMAEELRRHIVETKNLMALRKFISENHKSPEVTKIAEKRYKIMKIQRLMFLNKFDNAFKLPVQHELPKLLQKL